MRASSPGRLLAEGPEGVVHLHLRDGHGLGPAGAHLEVNAIAVKDGALEGELLDRRRARLERPKPIAGEQPRGCKQECHKRNGEPEHALEGEAAGSFKCPRGLQIAACHLVHDATSTTSNIPIQPSSVNSDWWAWNMYWPTS